MFLEFEWIISKDLYIIPVKHDTKPCSPRNTPWSNSRKIQIWAKEIKPCRSFPSSQEIHHESEEGPGEHLLERAEDFSPFFWYSARTASRLKPTTCWGEGVHQQDLRNWFELDGWRMEQNTRRISNKKLVKWNVLNPERWSSSWEGSSRDIVE